MTQTEKPRPVFYDAKRRRWLAFKVIGTTIMTICAAILAVLVVALVKNPQLPQLTLQSIAEFSHAAHPLQQGKKELSYLQSKRSLLQFLKKTQTKTKTSSAQAQHSTDLIGFFVNWDDTSWTSLKANMDSLDMIIPEWLHMSGSSGAVIPDNADKQAHFLTVIRQQKPSLKIDPLINNYNSTTQSWDSQGLATLLATPQSRQTLIQNLLQYVQSNQFQGISIDFESVPPASQSDLVQFMTELSTTFHSAHLEVSQSLPIDDDSYDYQKLGQLSDFVVLMAYDQHWSNGPAGPVAAQTWFESTLQKRFSEIPPQHIIISVGNYGYDWQDKTQSATELSFQDVVQTAHESDATMQLDPDSLNGTFDYYDDNNALHHVWYLDGVTAFNQFTAGSLLHPRGWALWRLGSEDPSFWSVANNRDHLDQSTVDDLKTMRYGYDIDYEGDGEVLKITGTPQDGLRNLQLDPQLGLITQDTIAQYPSPYIITRWGAQSKKLAVTFDDGPDPKYTEQILDILRQHHIPATFFVIGENGDMYPNVLQDIDKDGNEIGIHTYTHPNIANISQEQLGLELNASERLLESRIGRSSLLFRPPYAEDIEPSTPNQVKPLVFTSGLGYYTISMHIDPQDWLAPPAETIVNSVVSQVASGSGNIILLHDGGGDRSQTVLALPKIIETLQAQGYQFVPVSTLMGLKRDDVMPLLSTGQVLVPSLTGFAFTILHWFQVVVAFLFWIGIILGTLRLLFVTSLAVIESLKSRKQEVKDLGNDPSVAVIIPAYNEDKVIVHTVQSILDSAYPKLQVIVIDDGSTDDTVGVLRRAFAQVPAVEIFALQNRGKGDALNFGVRHTDANVIVAVDADTLLEKTAIAHLVKHFVNPRVGAVAGNAKVGNRHSLLTRWQALEYITSQNLDRRAFALLNCITVVPGAIGAWRRELIVHVGGFATDTLAEDADLTLSILEAGYLIRYEDKALGFTEAPTTIGRFLKQRFRWTFGTLQVVWKHRRSFLSLKVKNLQLSLVALPNVLIFQIFFPLVSPLMDVMMVNAIVNLFIQKAQHPDSPVEQSFLKFCLFYALFLCLDFAAAAVAFLLEKKENWTLLFWLFWQRFLYRQLMYYAAIKSVIMAIRGSRVGWNKLEREGLEPKL